MSQIQLWAAQENVLQKLSNVVHEISKFMAQSRTIIQLWEESQKLCSAWFSYFVVNKNANDALTFNNIQELMAQANLTVGVILITQRCFRGLIESDKNPTQLDIGRQQEIYVCPPFSTQCKLNLPGALEYWADNNGRHSYIFYSPEYFTVCVLPMVPMKAQQ